MESNQKTPRPLSRTQSQAIEFLMAPMSDVSAPQLGDPEVEVTPSGIRAGVVGGRYLSIPQDAVEPLGLAIKQRVMEAGEAVFIQANGATSRGGPTDIAGDWFSVLREKSTGEVTINRFGFGHLGRTDSLRLAFDNAMALSTILGDIAPLVQTKTLGEIAAAHGGSFHHGPARVLEMRNPVLRRTMPTASLQPDSLEDDLRAAEDSIGKEKGPEEPAR